MISPLNRKLLRDVWLIKGQISAIILVMAAGIAIFVIMFGVLDSLRLTQSTYYDRYQFADVFTSLKRAPESLKKQIAEIPGVSVTETRVVFGVTLQMDSLPEPATGRIISVPDDREALLNKLYLRAGRTLYPNEDNSVLVDDAFFKAHNLELGDAVPVILNGHKRSFKVVGVVFSPEYVYSIAPGALMPDAKRFGLFWMSRRSLEAAVNMKGAFNDLALKVERDANLEDIKQRIDQLLKPYGGLIAYTKEVQLSNFFVENELKQLESLGWMAPVIFLSVAAFLINVVMSRQIATQREQIGMLKAVGYSDLEISLHYLKMVMFITSIGSVIGLSLGGWMGTGMTEMYATLFRFPILKYSFSIEVMVFAVLFCVVSAVLGTLFAIKRAANLPPAEAMRPESPTEFKPTIIEELGLHKQLSFLSRIILRQLERRPIRAMMSALGMAFALAILVFSFFMEDSMTYLMDVQYDMTQREDLNISFIESRPDKVLEEIKIIPGVLKVEPVRYLPVILRSQHYKKRSTITGLQKNPELRRVVNDALQAVEIPETGLVINSKLASILQVGIGDYLQVEVLEEKRPTLSIPIAGITQEFIGMGVYMRITELSRLLDQSPKIDGASISVDENHSGILYKKLKEIPAIVGLNNTIVLRKIFEDIMAENLLKMVSTNILFASFISFGVIYNTARIALSERGRELASLRVLGLTRREVAYLLFGELSVITLVSIPLGLLVGYLMVVGMVQSLDSELYRIPTYISKSTYGYSALIVLISAIVSFYIVWRQVDKIDLVTAQKGVE